MKGGAIVSDMTLGNADDKARPILKAEMHRNGATFGNKSVEMQTLQKLLKTTQPTQPLADNFW